MDTGTAPVIKVNSINSVMGGAERREEAEQQREHLETEPDELFRKKLKMIGFAQSMAQPRPDAQV